MYFSFELVRLSSAVLLDKVQVRVSVFSDFIVGLLGDFKHRVVLFAAKLVFDAVFSDVLFHKHILSFYMFYRQGTIKICFECRKAKYFE